MDDAGRRARVFPNEPFDGWRGQAHEIQGRLMEVIDYSSEGPAAWYRDIAKNVLRLVCEHPGGPPRSSRAVLERMEIGGLRTAHEGSSALEALTAEQVRQVRLRYEAFFGQTRGALDGSWAWEDTDAAYLLLDSLALREETSGLARFLFEDFAHYFTTRKARERFCLLIVDEFSALAQGAGMAARIEQARGFHTGLVLAPQVVQGMGDENEAARITGSVETVICHRVNTPEEIVRSPGHDCGWSTRPTTGRRAAPARDRPGSSISTRSIRTRSVVLSRERRTSSVAVARCERRCSGRPTCAASCPSRRGRTSRQTPRTRARTRWPRGPTRKLVQRLSRLGVVRRRRR